MKHKTLPALKGQALLELLMDVCGVLQVSYEEVMHSGTRLRVLSDTRIIFIHHAYDLGFESRDMCVFLGFNHASVAYLRDKYDDIVDSVFESKKQLVEKHLNDA